MLVGAGIIASVPVIAALPFLVWNADGFVSSILFSVTRLADTGTSAVRSLDAYLGGAVAVERILMLLLMCLLYGFAARRPAVKYAVAFLVMFTFVGFNPVLFPQYLVWLIPPALLAICDLDHSGRVSGAQDSLLSDESMLPD